MLKRTYGAIAAIAILAVTGAAVSAQTAASTQGAAALLPKPVKAGYAPVNGLAMYYEIYGQGQPLVLLHGALGAIEMYGSNIAALAAHRQVIAADLQGHGRTADIDRPISYEGMGDDVAALIRYLGLGRADVMGYSLGGGAALQTAIRHPDVVRRLVLVSTAYKRDGWYPEILAGEAQMGPQAAEAMKQTPMYAAYAGLAPRPQEWPILLGKLHDLLVRDYDWSAGVAGLKIPVMLVAGDADAVRTADVVGFFGLLGGGKRDAGWDGSGRPTAQLAILAYTTHYDIFASPALPTVVIPFLDAQ